MTLLSKLKRALQQEGFAYVAKTGPQFLKARVQQLPSDMKYRLINPKGHISRDELISRCEESNSIWHYGSHEEFEIVPPLYGGNRPEFQEIIGIHTSPKSFVCEIENVRLTGDRALSKTRDGRYILEEMGTKWTLRSQILKSFDQLGGLEKARKICSPMPSSRNNTDYELIVNLVPRHGTDHNNYVNFGHWLLEDLPRLRGYDRYEMETGRQPVLLLKRDTPEWMKETLRLLGFSSVDWTEWEGQPASVSRLVVPKLSYVHSVGSEYQPSDRSWVADVMKSEINLEANDDLPDRVFVSRQGQDRRKIVNFDDVMATLSTFGFEAVRPEELSIRDQIRLFHNAEYVIGPSGSAMANLIFAEDATVIEILSNETQISVWYVIANEQNLDYCYLQGEAVPEERIDSSRNLDIEVDTKKFQQLLESAIGTK